MPTPNFDVQLEGNIKFCTVDSAGVPATGAMVDYSDQIARLLLNRTRNSVTRKPTFADARSIQRAGDLVEKVTVEFIGDETQATDFFSIVWTALETPPCELYFTATMKVGAPSATNPIYRGYVLVTDIDGGGVVGESKWQSKTWAARNITKAAA